MNWLTLAKVKHLLKGNPMNREILEKMNANTIGESLGIVITRLENAYVEGTMPVDHRTRQPYGLLHGGASVALAETLGSVGSHFLVADQGKGAVGIEINANHIKGKKDGVVTGKATLKHKGGRLHVWVIDIVDEENQLIATSRLTVMIVPGK